VAPFEPCLVPGEVARHGKSESDQLPTRREFFSRIPRAPPIALASTAISFSSSGEAGQTPSDPFQAEGQLRAEESYLLRQQAARDEGGIRIPSHITNRDEQTYSNFIGNFSKGLPHNRIGEVDPKAYRLLLNAVRRGTAEAFEQVPLGGTVMLVNPMAGVAFDLEGTDSHQLAIPPFPPLASQEMAAEAVELYWMALCRDVNFTDYATDKLAGAAAAELSKLKVLVGPRAGRGVTPQTLFRGTTAGDVIGPYVSQLLLKEFNYGPYQITGQMTVSAPGTDYLTDQGAWLACRNGRGPFPGKPSDSQTRYIRNGRDLASYVHNDGNAGGYMAFHNAGIFLVENNAPLNPGNPYLSYKGQSPFGTFGTSYFLCLMGEVAERALKAVWYAKWFVHRSLRPEDYGGLVHMTKTRQTGYPLHGDILNSAALANVVRQYGAYFLPQAYPEGCPQHPSYAQGHSSIAGACATILKAAFDGSAPFSILTNGQIVTARGDGLALVPYTDADAGQITLNGEIDKLASNIGLARDIAGIHWRSDCKAGLLLGETVAISILRDQRSVYVGEKFEGFTITKFDGTTITV
jgi:hypothetical protein